LLQKSFFVLIYVNEHAKNRIERTYPSIIAPQAARTHREDTGTTGVSGPARYQPQESVGKMRGLEMAKAGSRKARNRLCVRPLPA